MVAPLRCVKRGGAWRLRQATWVLPAVGGRLRSDRGAESAGSAVGPSGSDRRIDRQTIERCWKTQSLINNLIGSRGRNLDRRPALSLRAETRCKSSLASLESASFGPCESALERGQQPLVRSWRRDLGDSSYPFQGKVLCRSLQRIRDVGTEFASPQGKADSR